ncbi:hypothetical protein FRC15_011125 [Serendipita sp. 397]|nr:hypothetical protein FRC15_011125 [Serendipita sp. 397]
MTTTIELKATQSKVHAVTVFQADRAEVSRLFKIDLKSGQNEVEISQLPTVLDEDSIRVDGVGGNAIISDVIYHPPTSNDSDKKHEEAVKEMQKEKSILEQELAVYKKQEEVLINYSQTLKGADTTGQKLEEFLDIYSKRQGGIDQKARELRAKIEEVDEKIRKEREVWSADTEGKKRAVRVTVVVYAENDGEAEICLTYMVSNASWTPLYDLRAIVGPTKTTITLHYRATIVQSTGEDWKEVELTLSTASPQLGSTIPTLSPLWLNPIVQQQYYTKSKRQTKSASFFAVPSSAPRPSAPGGPLGFGGEDYDRLGVPEAKAVEGTMSTSFVIEGLSTIPSDTDLKSQAHKVSVAVLDLTADLEWISVPKEKTSAFLQARVKNLSSYMLLPGKTNISVKNTRSAPIKKLIVRDQIPVSGDQRIKAVVLEPANIEFTARQTIASSANAGSSSLTVVNEKGFSIPKEVQVAKGIRARWKVGDDELNQLDAGDDSSSANNNLGLDGAREGMIEWVCEIPAGQNVDVTLAWEVTAPTSLNWGPQ